MMCRSNNISSASLYLYNDVAEPFDLDKWTAHRWTDSDLPNLLSCETIVAEVPTQLINMHELRAAEEYCQNLIWLITPKTTPQQLGQILPFNTDAEALQLRTPASPSLTHILSKPFNNYLSTAPISLLFPLAKPWRPIAQTDGGNLNSAIYRKLPSGGFSFILPSPDKSSPQTLDLLLSSCAIFSGKQNPLSAPIRLHSTSILLLLILLCSITIARYHQKSSNRYFVSHQPTTVKLNSPLNRHTEDSLSSLSTISPNAVTTRSEYGEYLQTFNSLRLDEQEVRFLNHLKSQISTHKWALPLLASYLHETVSGEILSYLETRQFERARWRAQLFINYTNWLYAPYSRTNTAAEEGKAFIKLHKTLNVARAVTDLVNHNYLYANPSAVSQLIARIDPNRTPSSDFSVSSAPDLDPSLLDNITYSHIALQASNSQYEDIQLLWSSFCNTFRDSEKIDEAHFNVLKSAISSQNPRFSRHDLAARCNDFANDFERSYLADDALMYSLLIACDQQDPVLIHRSFLALKHLHYSTGAQTDSYKLVHLLCNQWFLQAFPLSHRDNNLIYFLFSSEINIGPDETLNSFVSNRLDKPTIHWLLRPLLNSDEFLDLSKWTFSDLLGGFFIQWREAFLAPNDSGSEGSPYYPEAPADSNRRPVEPVPRPPNPLKAFVPQFPAFR